MSEHETPLNTDLTDFRLVRREEVLFRASNPLNFGIDLLVQEEFRGRPWVFRSEQVAFFGIEKALSRSFHEELGKRQQNLEKFARKPLVVRRPQLEVAKNNPDRVRLYFEPASPAYLDNIVGQVTKLAGNINNRPETKHAHMVYTDIALSSLIPKEKRASAGAELHARMNGSHADLFSVMADTIIGPEVYQQERFLLPDNDVQEPVVLPDGETPDVARRIS